MIDWTEQVRESTLFVTKNSIHAHINYGKIRELASQLHPPRNEPHPLIPTEDLRDWVFLISMINFSFWPDEGRLFEVEYQAVKYRGYWAMCAIIKRLLDSGKQITDPRQWLCSERIEDWFLGITNYIPMLQERVQVLKEAHDILYDLDFDFDSLILDSILETLDHLITLFPSLRDWSWYKGKRVYFLKRAQIMLADWGSIHLSPEKFPNWGDLRQLTMFADYRVPAVLFEKEYSEELKERIRKKVLLEHGSEMEVEIRAASVQAIEELARLTGFPAYQVDYFLWDSMSTTSYPHHRTRSIYY